MSTPRTSHGTGSGSRHSEIAGWISEPAVLTPTNQTSVTAYRGAPTATASPPRSAER
jgi:hypothetical protein